MFGLDLDEELDIKKIRNWEIYSVIFILIVGALFHELYKFTKIFIFSFISPVNESVWEHNKMIHFSLMIFMFIELYYLRDNQNNFFLSRFVIMVISPLIIIFGFYIYEFFFGHSLFFDIILFIIAIIVSHSFSYRILISEQLNDDYETFSVISIILLTIIYFIFTLIPPKIDLFLDSITLTYGLQI
jgi:hypothetical protein